MSNELYKKGVLVMLLSASLASLSAEGTDWKWERYGLPKSELKTCTPETRGDQDFWWIPYFQEKLKQPRKDLLFIGDSITDLWTYPADHQYPGGLNTWNKRYKDIATNFGITGDKTQTVLWRLTEGKYLEGYTPKHIIILIGINNLLQNDTPEDTAAGIKAIVDYLRKVLPVSKVLILGIFPCHKQAADPIRAKIRMTNERIKKLADSQNVYFIDIGNVFLENDGAITKDVMRDLLHLSPKGYEMWADAMEPSLKAFLNNEPFPVNK
ncbi:MAG: GDSL-type esterase/lipase family protein [Lentisphaerota bacterium]